MPNEIYQKLGMDLNNKYFMICGYCKKGFKIIPKRLDNTSIFDDLVIYCSMCNRDFEREYNIDNKLVCCIHPKSNCEFSKFRIMLKDIS
ncbi:MAG: hypothetical protein ACFFG0_30265 [Candidatus Thorarchaeota archaeon]